MPACISISLLKSSMKTDCLLERELPLDMMMPLIREQLSRNCSVRLSPRGTSMLPMLRQGRDSVLLSPLPERLKRYDLPLYQREDGSYILHRIVKVQDAYTCLGDNQFDEEYPVTHEQMIAVVSAFYRGKRMIRCNALGYQLYCRVWYASRGIRHFWRRGIGWLRRHLR